MTGDQLKAWRKQYSKANGLNLTQPAFAKALGIPLRRYRAIESADSVPMYMQMVCEYMSLRHGIKQADIGLSFNPPPL